VRVFKSNGQPASENNGYASLINGERYHLKLKNDDKRDCVAKVTIDGKEMGIFFIRAFHHFIMERPGHDSGKLTFYTIDSVEGKQLQLSTEVAPDKLGLITVEFVPIQPETVRDIVGDGWGYKHYPDISFTANRSFGAEQQYSTQINNSSKIELEDNMTMGFCSMENLDAPLFVADSSSGDRGWVPGMSLSDHIPAPKKRGGTGLSGESNVEYKQIDIKPERFLFSEMVTIHLRLVAVESYENVRKLTATPRATPIPAPV